MLKKLKYYISVVVSFYINGIFSLCPDGTYEYNNQSCYLFLGPQETAHLHKNVWNEEKRPFKYPSNGLARGRLSVSLESCTWNKEQAVQACEDAHLARPDLAQLANNDSVKWHLPALETEEEDDWLYDMIIELKENGTDIGTNFWIDLIDNHDVKL